MSAHYKKIVFIVLAVLLISGGVACAFFVQKDESGEIPKSNVTQQGDQQTFSDKKFRFSFSYPQNWHEVHSANTVKVCEALQTVAYPDSEQKGFCVSVEAFELPDPGFLTLDNEPRVTQKSQKTIGGKAFNVTLFEPLSESNKNIPWYGVMFQVDQNGYSYRITGRSFSSLNTEQEKAVEDIAASFVIREDVSRTQQFLESSGAYEVLYPANWSATEKNDLVSFGSPTWEGEPEWNIEKKNTSAAEMLQSVRSSSNNGSLIHEGTFAVKSGEKGTMFTFRKNEQNTFVFVVSARDSLYIAKGSDYKTQRFEDMVSSINFLR